MKPIYTKEEWQKVRLLARKWYRQMSWLSSPLLYVVLAISGGLALYNRFDVKWFTLFLITGGYLYAREEKIESYVDGWNQGQDYITGDITIDELLEYDKKVEKKTEGKKND